MRFTSTGPASARRTGFRTPADAGVARQAAGSLPEMAGRAEHQWRLGMYLRTSLCPWRRLLKLAGHLDEYILPAVGGDQLHADRQAAGCPVQGKAHRGL